MDELSMKLKNIYCELNDAGVRPVNAWRVRNKEGNMEYARSPIPFVGRNYVSQPEGCKVLLYASAENLNGHKEEDARELCEISRMDRSRQEFERTKDNFFPSVHIQPISDGGLLVVAYQVLKRLIGDRFEEIYGDMKPAEFLECISCSNYGKFTIHNTDNHTNLDYGKKAGIPILEYCHDYLKADIDILKPDIVILPRGIFYGADQEKLFFNKYYPDMPFHIQPVYQINAQVVNCTINPAMKKGKYNLYFEEKMLTENELEWHQNIERINQDNFLSVYAYIDSIMN